ncbi:hypothetical protein F5Y15DRAFT_363839 [Xylariaceae sp. FL0016]|nr:hypothetical protein F5Y15DRAFT_363839 [Xylariaceae sp. FL0016]
MGGYDNYCAICGIKMGAVFMDDDSEIDRSLIQEDDLTWLDDIRLMGENPNAPSQDKIFIAASAIYDDCGFYNEVDGGDDPNFWSDEDRPEMIRALDWDAEHPLLVPFHGACLDLLTKKLRTDEIDRVSLYEVMRSLCDPSEFMMLSLDWGEIEHLQDQYFFPEKGCEAFLRLPTTIPELTEYYGKLPRAEIQTITGNSLLRNSTPQNAGSDRFATISTEVMLLIMECMDMISVTKLRVASSSALRVQLPSAFWKAQLLYDLPWLYDFPSLDGDSITSIDWPKVYKELLLASSKGSQNMIPGLVNRRRIWQVTDQLADPYAQLMRGKRSRTAGSDVGPAPILDKVNTTVSRMLAKSGPELGSMSNVCFVRGYDDLANSEPVLFLHWTQQGILCGISTQSGLQNQSAQVDSVIGSEKFFSSSDTIHFPRDDWLTGIVATIGTLDEALGVMGARLIFAKQETIQLGNSEGYQRLFRVPKGEVLVGLNGGCSRVDGRLSKLSLLCQPLSRIPAELNRVEDLHEGEYNYQCQGYLWFNELPAPGLLFGKTLAGYWKSGESDTDLCPMESLVFGTSEQELSELTAISGDVHFGGFQTQHLDGTTRKIGPRHHAMKTLTINGGEGERISGIYVYTGHITYCIRFVTNQRRQLVIGQPKGQPTPYTSEEINNKPLPSGIIANWGARPSPKARLDQIGPLSCENLGPVDTNDTTGDCDSQGYPWEPCAPPAHLAETGDILGRSAASDRKLTLTQRRGAVPGDETVVCWLDCSRPLLSVTVTMCHGIRADYAPIAALRFRYADETEACVGPTSFSPPKDTEGKNGMHWCWCALGSRRKEEEDRPHYVHDIWDVGDRHLRSLRLWTNGQGIGRLAAIQMVADDELEGPIWGYGRPGEYNTSISIGGPSSAGPRTSPSAVEALKFFIGDNDRAVTYGDSVLVAVQGLRTM